MSELTKPIEAIATAKSIPLNRPAAQWLDWINKVMLSLGITLFLAGIVFFFAYNWADMSKFSKFLIVETGIIGAFAMAAMKLKSSDAGASSYDAGASSSDAGASGYDTGAGSSVSGQMYLLAASVLTGVLLAIFGQTYQTGADAFTLFAAWAFLITGWLATGKSGSLWVLWIILWNIAYVTWYEQVIGSASRDSSFIIAFILMNIVGLGAREYLAKKGCNWLSNRGTRWFSLMLVIYPSTAYLLELIFGRSVYYEDSMFSMVTTGLLCSSVIFGSLYTYRYIFPELFSLFLPVTSLSILILAFIGKVIFEDADKLITMFGFSVITLFVAGMAIVYLQSVMKIIRSDGTSAKVSEEVVK